MRRLVWAQRFPKYSLSAIRRPQYKTANNGFSSLSSSVNRATMPVIVPAK
jgi:hypothetical protein